MALPLAAILAGVGGALLSGRKTSQANKQAQYAQDQARKDYEMEQLVAEERDRRRMDSIDFLKAVAKGRGYNIPEAAFTMLNARGPFKLPSADQRFAKVPKGNSWLDALIGGVGTGLQTYGLLSGSRMAGETGPPTFDGGMGTASNIAPPFYPGDEFSFGG